MQQCLEIWLIVVVFFFFFFFFFLLVLFLFCFLSGLSCKPDVLSSASILTDIMKPRSNMEPGRDEQRLPASQKND